MTRTQSISWFRIGAESVAILVSILLAFAIDAWWETQQEREEEQVLLEALKDEAQHNLKEIDRELIYRRAAADAVMTPLDASAGNTTLAPAELDQALGSLQWWSEASWSTGAFNSLIQGGRLTLIESDSLRSMVAALPDSFDEIKRNELLEYETFRNVLMPFLYRNALVPQLANARRNMPGGAEDFPQRLVPVGGYRDHADLLQNAEFIGIITNRLWDEDDAISFYSLQTVTLENLIQAIDEGLRD